MSVDKELLQKVMAENFSPITEEQLGKFYTYSNILVDYNQKVNLTAITDPKDIAIKHFLDSVMVLKYFDVKANATMIDVGTGAGFPSLPCKIIRPDIKLTMLDSLNKRINFLSLVSEEMGFSENICLHARAEDGGKNPKFREKFDIATARAVANLAVLSEYCLPFVKIGGVFIALKGPDAAEEIEAAKSAINHLGGKLEAVFTFELPENNSRTLIVIRKISQTPTKFPRISAKIAKEPLL